LFVSLYIMVNIIGVMDNINSKVNIKKNFIGLYFPQAVNKIFSRLRDFIDMKVDKLADKSHKELYR
jgi:hypothetical protein